MIYSVHYACESLTGVRDGPASVACVAFQDVHTGAAQAFSLANVGDGTADVREREVLLLRAALQFFRDRGEARWVHWKMSRPEYGFEALRDRLRWITGDDTGAVPPVERRFDLEGLIAERYGPDFAPHPRLPMLIARNGMRTHYARWGIDEPNLITSGDLLQIQQSATEKVRLLAEILAALVHGRLQTETAAGDVDFAGELVDAVGIVLTIAERARFVQRELSRRHAGRQAMSFNDEYDAQDLVRALLRLFFDDVRDEEWVPTYAGGASRIDFLLPETRVAVELKWTRDSMTSVTLGNELIVDREKYQAHPSVGHLVCIVFDYDGRLRNPRGLEQDLGQQESASSIATTVRIVDR